MLSIPELATEIVENSVKESSNNTSRTLFVVGSKACGKSSLLYSFLDKNDTPRETLALEYSFGRKISQRPSIDKIVCHVWEYGGKLDLLKNVLATIPLEGICIYCIMIDLSKIKSIWATLEPCLQTYSEVKKISNLVIIGGKYDLFKNYDNEIKKIICITIRSVALILDANVIFYSTKDSHLMKRGKDMLQNMAFGNLCPFKEKNTKFAKPLLVPKGADSWESIGIPTSTIEQVKMRHLSRIPLQQEVVETDLELTLKPRRNQQEPVLDAKAALKYEEMRSLPSLDIFINEYLARIM